MSEEKLSNTDVTQGNFELPLPPNSLDLHQTWKQHDDIMDSPHILIFLSNTRNENIKN